ncbi:linear amide C-N hydrolase, choloylglycine hydrolase family protein [Cooperia oncophora]
MVGTITDEKNYVPKQLLPAAFWIAGKLNLFFPYEYAEEIRGIANASGLPLGLVVSMNILYDILAFDRKHILQLGCTSIVAQNANGTIFHGRNLDYPMGDLLKNVTIIADFTRGRGRDKRIVYSGVTFALSSILLTGQNDAFTLSLNARCKDFRMSTVTRFMDHALIIRQFGPYFMPDFCLNIFNVSGVPTIRTLLIFSGKSLRVARIQVLASSKTYSEALNHLSNRHLFSPSYIILGGRERGEGAIISRDRMRAADVRTLSDDRWFLVETNFDPWKKPGDKRRATAQKKLTAIGQKGLNAETMLEVLRTVPVKNDLTLFSTVMSARFPSLMRNTTFIWT